MANYFYDNWLCIINNTPRFDWPILFAHLSRGGMGKQNKTTHQVSLVGAKGNMWWKTRIETKTMLTELGVNSKHELSRNITNSYGLNIKWFHVELFT
jgi:hypothetical protein